MLRIAVMQRIVFSKRLRIAIARCHRDSLWVLQGFGVPVGHFGSRRLYLQDSRTIGPADRPARREKLDEFHCTAPTLARRLEAFFV